MAKNEANLLIRITQKGGEVLDKIGDGLKTIGEVATVVGGAIFTFGAMAIRSFREAELASNELTQSMIQQGIYTTELKKKYDAQADALSQVTLFQDEAITSAQAILQSQLGQKEVSDQLMKATLDLAAAKKIDLASAAELVGKSIGTETNALARQGIQISDTTDKTKRMSEVIQQLNGKFGGQAEAATSGLGALEMLKKTASEFVENVGQRLAPVVIGLSNSLRGFVTDIMNSQAAMDGIMSVFQAVAQIGVVVKGVFDAVGKTIGNVLAGTFGAINDLVEGNFKSAWNNAKSIVSVTTQDMVDVWAKGKEDMKYVNDLFLQSQQENAVKEEELMRQSNERKNQIRQEQKAIDDQFFITKNAEELERQALHAQILADQDAMQKLNEYNRVIKTSNDKLAVLQAQTAKEKLIKDQEAKLDIARETGLAQFRAMLDSQRVKDAQTVFGQIATLQNSHSKELVAIGKAAAIANAIINTAQGVTLALATFPPPFSFVLAGLVAAAGAAQIATIAGTKMAEGGLVKATPGGVPAIIGEGGKDEMVIPLDDPEAQSRMGGGMTVHFHGPILGDESQADAFARALDRAFLRLRQRNESVAFESDVV